MQLMCCIISFRLYVEIGDDKYSKISNILITESNRIVSNYSIRFEISNIRTALQTTRQRQTAMCSENVH